LSLNSLGLGFSFGAKDTGMKKQVSDQTKHLTLMGQAVETLNKILSINRLQTFISSISLSTLSNIADGIAGIAEKGRNLTTSFEATMTASAKTGYAMAANLGYSGKALGKFSAEATNLSISLNTSVETAGKAAYAWAQGKDELKLVGITSAATAAKVSEVFGLDPSKLVFQLKEMKKSLGLTDDELKSVVDSTMALGQQTGDVSKVMQSLPGQIESMREQAHSLGKTLSGKQVAQYAVSTNEAAQLLYSLTNNAESAEKAARDLGSQMIGAGKDFASMFAGTKTELPEFFQSLAIAGVDVDKQFELMKSGPTGMIQGLAEMVDAAKKQGKDIGPIMNFAKKHMEAALGKDVANQLAGTFEAGGDALADMLKKLPKASGSLGSVAEAAHKTGRTLAEQMDLQESMFVARLRTTSTAGASFVKDTGAAYKDWGDKLLKISKGGGPLALITNKMIEMHQVGAMALIPKTLRPMAGVFGTMAKESAPLIGMLGSLGFRLGMLASPITIVIAAFALLAYWFVSVQKKGEHWTKTVARMGEQAGEFFSKTLPKYLKLGLTKISEFGSYLAKVVPPLVMKFAKYLQKSYPKVVAALKHSFEMFFAVVVPWLGVAIPKLMASMGAFIRKWAPKAVKFLLEAYVWVYKEIANGLVWLGKKFWEYLPTILDTLSSLVTGAANLARDLIVGLLDGIRDYLMETFPEYADTISNVFQFLSDFVSDTAKIIGEIFAFVVDSWKTVIKFINDEIANGGETFKAFGRVVSEMFWGLWDDVKSVFAKIGELITAAVEIWAAPFKMIDGWADKLFRHSIDTEMNVSFDKASKHAESFSKDMSKSLTTATAPLGGVAPSAGAGGAKPLPPSIRKPMVSAGDTQASLVNAVNMPAWYARYEALFNARMSALEAAVSGGGGAPKGGRASLPSVGRKSSSGGGGDDGMAHLTGISGQGMPTKGG